MDNLVTREAQEVRMAMGTRLREDTKMIRIRGRGSGIFVQIRLDMLQMAKPVSCGRAGPARRKPIDDVESLARPATRYILLSKLFTHLAR
jgi:hypothetical protein